MEEKEFPSSDDSDSDFEVNLEEELSGDSEQSDGEGSESEAGEEEKSSSKKKTKKGKTRKKRTKAAAKKTRSSNVEETDSNSKQSTDSASKLTAEQEKERADSLWKSFLSDASIPSKSQPNTPKSTAKSSPSKKGSNSVDTNKEESLKQEEEIGEIKFKKVEETKTKALDIREIVKPSLKSPLTSTNENGNKCKVTSPLLTQENSSKKRGISSLLGNMQKKTKLSTLEKSKLDWNQFKEEQNLQEEITTFNRGKNGYLEKQDFLQRTDTRQFELEKELRNVGRRKAR